MIYWDHLCDIHALKRKTESLWLLPRSFDEICAFSAIVGRNLHVFCYFLKWNFHGFFYIFWWNLHIFWRNLCVICDILAKLVHFSRYLDKICKFLRSFDKIWCVFRDLLAKFTRFSRSLDQICAFLKSLTKFSLLRIP